ncbi:MAG: response regulator [Bacteroidetes bacterium]|nr:response regulator [Bacteroidota bacterium]
MKKASSDVPKHYPSDTLAGKKILVVDENKTNITILESILKSAGIKVTLLLQGNKTIETLEQSTQNNEPFDTAILAHPLTTINGCKLAENIRRSNLRFANIPLLAYSSSSEKIAATCKAVGFNGFLTKPAAKEVLLRTLSKLLSRGPMITDDIGVEKLVTQYSILEELKHSVHILLAEDNPVNQKLATITLTKAVYQVTVTENGQEAARTFLDNTHKFDIILMDIQMPVMAGYEAARLIRNCGYDNIPIIAMTANAMKEDKQCCLDAGMNDYISKPVKRENMFKMLNKWHTAENQFEQSKRA